MRNDHRTEWYTAQVVDGGHILRELDVEDDATVTRQLSADTHGTGSVSVSLQQVDEIPWETCQIRIWYHQPGRDIPLLTGIPSVGDEEYEPGRVVVSVDLFDPTSMLADEQIGQMWGVNTETPVLEAVRGLIASVTSGVPVVFDDSTATLAAAITWSDDTSKLAIINQLLAAIGWNPLWADPMGRLRSEPVVDPAIREIKWAFTDDAGSLIVPGWKRTTNRSGIPNRLRCIQRVDGNKPADVAVVTNEDPNSPFSFQGRGGRWITRTERDVDAADFDTLQTIAAQKLREQTQVTGEFSFSHPVLDFSVGDVVTFRHSRIGPTPIRCQCTSQRITCRAGQMVASTFQEVVNV